MHPTDMLYSEALGISENTIPYCILMIILGIASHYASRIRGEADVKDAKQMLKEYWDSLKKNKILWRILLS